MKKNVFIHLYIAIFIITSLISLNTGCGGSDGNAITRIPAGIDTPIPTEVTGPTGPTGPEGPTGPVGPSSPVVPGPPGSTGPAGPANTGSVKVNVREGFENGGDQPSTGASVLASPSTITSSAAGDATINNLLLGDYTLTVTKNGFVTKNIPFTINTQGQVVDLGTVTLEPDGIFVDNVLGVDAPGNGSWLTPYATIPFAINDRSGTSGKTIIVRTGTGTYGGPVNFNVPGTNFTLRPASGVLSGSIIITDGILFNVDATLLDFTVRNATGSGILVNDSNPKINRCTVENSSSATGAGININNGKPLIENTRIRNCAATGNGGGIYMVNSSPVINTCTIGESGFSNSAGDDGGGIFIDNNSFPAITNSTVQYNTAVDDGGGISYNGTGSNVTITSSTIEYNAAADTGGGLRCNNSGQITVTGGAIQHNTAGNDGGGIWNDNKTLTVNTCTINDNTAADAGGGVLKENGTVALNNCIITNNKANGTTDSFRGGGAIYNVLGSGLTVTGCTINGNTASRNGGGIYNLTGTPSIVNCAITNNTANSNSDVNNDGGGGIYNRNDDITVSGCTIQGNTSLNDGGGIYLREDGLIGGSAPNFNTITANTATNRGGGIYLNPSNISSSGDIPNISYNNLFGNTSSGDSGNGKDAYFSLAGGITRIADATNNFWGAAIDPTTNDGVDFSRTTTKRLNVSPYAASQY